MEQIYKQHYDIEGVEFDVKIFYNGIVKINDEEYIHHFVIALERDNPLSSIPDYPLALTRGKLIEFFDFIESDDNGNKKQLPGNTLEEIMYTLFVSCTIGETDYQYFCLEYDFKEEDPTAIDWYREGRCVFAKMERLFPDEKESFKVYEYFLGITNQIDLKAWN